MFKRSGYYKIMLVMAAALLMTSCSAVRETEPSVKVTVVTESSTEATSAPSETTPKTTSAEKVTTEGSEAPADTETPLFTETTEEPDALTVDPEGFAAIEEPAEASKPQDDPLTVEDPMRPSEQPQESGGYAYEEYFKPQIEGDEFAIVADKTDYSALEDEILIDLADEFVDEGFMVFSADNLAEKGVFLSIDDKNYLYRGFMAMDIESEQSEVDYVYLMPEEVFDEIVESMDPERLKHEENDMTVTYFTDGLYISYLRDRGLMIYQAFPVG